MNNEVETLMTLAAIGLALIAFSLIVTAAEKRPGPASIARRRLALAACLLPVVASSLPIVILGFQHSREAVYRISASIDLVLIWLVTLVVIRQSPKIAKTIRKMLTGNYSSVYIVMLFVVIHILLLTCLLPVAQTYTVTLYIISVALSVFLAGHFLFRLAIYPQK